MRDFRGVPVVKTAPSDAGGMGSIPGWWANIPHASWTKNQSIKQKKYCKKLNKDFRDGPHKKYFIKVELNPIIVVHQVFYLSAY